MQPQPKDRREIESIVQNAISEAVDFVESEISEDRIKAQRYYDGEVILATKTGAARLWPQRYGIPYAL